MWLHVRIYIYIDIDIDIIIYILYIYIIYVYICQDGGAVGFVDFPKLSLALSSLAQPFNQIGSIPEHVFVILSLRRTFSK